MKNYYPRKPYHPYSGLRRVTVFLFWILSPYIVFGVECKDLNTPDKLKAFVEETEKTNPLMSPKLSVYLEISPCQQQECSKEQLNIRLQNTEQLHFVRYGNNYRAFFYKGAHAPQCVVSTPQRQSFCTSCEKVSNNNCREIPKEKAPTVISGTNIDMEDFGRLKDKYHTSECHEIPNTPKYLLIKTIKKSGPSPYDLIETYYDKEKKIPIVIEFSTDKVLRKVYRFFPKYYVQINKEWVATIVRVRSTQGDEQKYLFETQVQILREKDQAHIYLEPYDDPVLNGDGLKTIFRTN